MGWPKDPTFHEKFKEDIILAYIESFDNFNEGTINQILAYQDEIEGNIVTEKLHADEEE